MSTISWGISAAGTASLPLGWLTTHLSIWLNGSEETAEGTLQILVGSPVTTPATWTTSPSGWQISVDNAAVQQGHALASTLTVTDANGAAVDLTGSYTHMRYTLDPTGSSTKIALDLVVRCAGTIYYTDYASGTFPRPTLAWPGVTVSLYDSTDVLIATTVTDSDGHYSFPGDIVAAGSSVYIAVSATAPPGDNTNQSGTGTLTAVDTGTNTLDLTCDRPPV